MAPVRPRASAVRWRARAAAVLHDRVTVSLVIVFVIGGAFYTWTAASTYPLSLSRNQTLLGRSSYYNDLATAFLHGELSIGAAPAGLIDLPNPYDPTQNAAYQTYYHDLTLYHGRFYMDWGPTPAVVLLVPLHLLGLGASSSLTTLLFALAGLAFALGTLRIMLRQFDRVPLWMGILAAAALVCSTTILFELRRPAVYEEAIVCGFCFMMAGVYIAMRTIQRRTASLALLALMSLCFGLAAGARPDLILTAALIVPVYLALRARMPRRPLLAALAVPLIACLLLLLAYNDARFGSPLEVGANYQLSEETQLAGSHSGVPHQEQLAGAIGRNLQFDRVSYLLPDLWYYGISPPRPTILFPFLALGPPPLDYPLGYPAGYAPPEVTGGVLVMTPLLLFAFALPWLWRARRRSLGALGGALLITGAAGLLILLFLSYQFYNTTERYETDFAVLLLIAALAAWFALASGAPGRRRRAVRVLGAVLAVWGCLTGLAIGFIGMENLLRTESPGTWSTLENATSPVATAMAMVVGHPVLGEVQAPSLEQLSPIDLTTLGAGTESFSLPAENTAHLTIVSPDRRSSTLLATVLIGQALGSGGRVSLHVTDASSEPQVYPVQSGVLNIPIELNRGVNRVSLTPTATELNRPDLAAPESYELLSFTSLKLAGS